MGYKSVIRSLGASIRRAERNAIRRQRELARQQKEYDKFAELERASFEVQEYENRIEQLITIHQDCSDVVDWKELKKKKQPKEPDYSSKNEDEANIELTNYKPGFFDKLFKKVEKKRSLLKERILTAKKRDEQIFEERKEKFRKELLEHEQIVTLAQKVLAGEPSGYVEALKELDPLSELSDLGSSLSFTIPDANRASIDLLVRGESAIPKQVKSLLKSEKLSVKDMPVGKFNELYQDYVCSAVLRIGREIFSLLPLQEVIITARAKLVDSVTGRLIEKPVLSVLIHKETLDQLDFMNLDPSDSMKNFKHNMGFKKSAGLSPVEEVTW
jgi:hypothetical protein